MLLLLPIGAIPWLNDGLSSRVAKGIAEGFATVSSLRQWSSARSTGEPLPPPASEAFEPPIAKPSELGAKRRSSLPSLRVGAPTVLQLAQRGVRPRGMFVAAHRGRPAGLLLLGVSLLGIGLKDGDVLTHVEGRSVSSESEVVSLVLSSRGAKVPRLVGKVWRRGQGFRTLVVEQPYLVEGAP